MQAKIPIRTLRDKTKYRPISAILKYIAASMDIDDFSYYNDLVAAPIDWDKTGSIFRVFNQVFSSHRPESFKPLWVDDVARIAAEILHELGWEDVPKPKWYLTTNTIGSPSSTDYNIFNIHV